MNELSARTAAIRMAILLVCVCALEVAVVSLAQQPLVWVRWIPGLIPLLAPLTIWEVFRVPSKSGK